MQASFNHRQNSFYAGASAYAFASRLQVYAELNNVFNYHAGGEEGKTLGWSATATRSRNLMNSGNLPRQKGPVANDSALSKEVRNPPPPPPHT